MADQKKKQIPLRLSAKLYDAVAPPGSGGREIWAPGGGEVHPASVQPYAPSFPPVFSLGSGNLCRKTESPERLLQSARDFLLKKRIKMKQTVSCKYQDTLELLRNEGANVT